MSYDSVSPPLKEVVFITETTSFSILLIDIVMTYSNSYITL